LNVKLLGEKIMDKEKICPKCKGKMKAGVIADNRWSNSGDHGWRDPADKGIIDGIFGSVDMYTITSYRCLECGFLENYAR